MKKIFKILLVVVGGILFLLASAYVFVRFKLPPEELQRLAEDQLSKRLGREVRISRVTVDLFHGLKIDGLSIGELGNGQEKFFEVGRVDLRYRLTPLLKRKLLLRQVIVTSPQLRLAIDEKGKWNFEDLLSKESVGLPVGTEVEDLDLKDLWVKFEMVNSSGTIRSQIKGINVKLQQLFVPRADRVAKGLPAHPARGWDVKFKAQSLAYKGPWQLIFLTRRGKTLTRRKINKIQINSQLQFEITSEATAPSEISAEGAIAFRRSFLNYFTSEKAYWTSDKVPELRVTFAVDLNPERGEAVLKELVVRVGKVLLLKGKGKIEQFNEAPLVDFVVEKGNLSLELLKYLISGLKITDLQNTLDSVRLHGNVAFDDLHLRGYLQEVNTQGEVLLTGFDLEYPAASVSVKGLNLKSSFTGRYDHRGLRQAVFEGQLSLSSEIKNFLGVTVVADVDLDFRNLGKRRKTIGLENIIGRGRFELKGLEIERLSGESLRGHLDLVATAKTDSSNKGWIDLRASSEDLSYLFKEYYEKLPVSEFKGQGTLRSGHRFRDVYVDRLKLSVNDIASAMVDGWVRNRGEEIVFFLKELQIDNSRLIAYFPSATREGFRNRKISGKTKLSGELRGHIDHRGQVDYLFDFHLGFADVEFDNPGALLKIEGLTGEAEVSGNPKAMKVNSTFRVAKLTKEDLFDYPIEGTELQLTADLIEQERLKLEQGWLKLPGLNSEVKFTGEVATLTTVPRPQVQCTFSFSADDTLRAIKNFRVTGNAQSEIGIGPAIADSTTISVSAITRLHNLDVYTNEGLSLQGVTGEIPFFHQLHTKNGEPIPKRTKAFDALFFSTYDLFRPYYKSSETLPANLKIDRICVQDYELTDVQMDMSIENGKIKVPYFWLKLYDGDIGGSFSLDVGNGNLETMGYWVKAQIARINSAKLPRARTGKAKESAISATMEFQGRGLKFTKEFEIDGHLQVTDIGPQFTDNMLRNLDPRGTDRSIQSARKLINSGFRPRRLSFQVRHGNFYPTIVFSQPWYYPLRLAGGKIELTRIPIKFILQSFKAGG